MNVRTVIAALSVLAAPILGAITTTFAGHAEFTTDTSPQSVAVGDLNNDGRNDVAVGNNDATPTVSVLLNTTAPGATSPSFAAKADFTTGAAPFAVAIADLNGDGKLDLVAANFSSATVSILRNTTTLGGGTASFAAKQDFALTPSAAPGAIAIGDVNGDGLLDLAIGCGSVNNANVLLNTTPPGNTTFSFATHADFTTNSSPGIAMADLNGDGLLDIADTGSGSALVSVLRNTTALGATTASFAARQDFATGNAPRSVAIGDFNGDGKPDLALACLGNPNGNLSVLLNTTATGATSFSFAAHQEFTGLLNSQLAIVRDLNGDGKPDVAMVGQGSANVSVFLNTTTPGASTPTFDTRLDYATAAAPWWVEAGDFNGDGKPDLVTANKSTTNVSVLLNTTASGVPVFYSARQPFSTLAFPSALAGADFNGDGKPDLATVEYLAAKVSVLVNTTAPNAAMATFGARQDFTVNSGARAVRAADLNGDGKPDLIALGYLARNISVLLNTTTPGASVATFAAKQDLVTSALVSGSDTADVVVGDLNGDGKPDIAVTNENASEVSVLINQTAGGATTFTFAARVSSTTPDTPGALAIGDINNDGRPDLTVCNHDQNNISIFLNASTPGGAASFGSAHTFGVNSASEVTVRDVNGDGKPDICLALPSGLGLMINTTAPGADPPTLGAAIQVYATGAEPTGNLLVTDLNGDGMPDVTAANSLGATISVLLNTTAPGASSQTFASKMDLSLGDDGSMDVTVADYNGDGRPDLATTNDDGNVSVLMNTVPASVEINTGDQQDIQVNAPYLPLATIIRGAGGTAIQLVPVTYVVVPGPPASGTFGGPTTVSTDSTGLSTAPTLTANNSIGPFTVTASAASSGVASPATFSLTNHAPNQVTDLVATAISSTAVSVTWTANPYATSYDVIRVSQYPLQTQTTVATQLAATSFTDTTATQNTAYLYVVRVSQPQGYPIQDLATTVMFTDPVLTPGTTIIKADHFTELRTAVNAVQVLAGQSPTSFNDALTAGSTPIYALHVNQLRQALQTARAAIGMSFSFSNAVAGTTKIMASDIEAMRNAVK